MALLGAFRPDVADDFFLGHLAGTLTADDIVTVASQEEGG